MHNKHGRPMENEPIYPVLYNWIIENYGSIHKFTKTIGVSDRGFRTFLYGSGGCHKFTIDKILELTGMTYEECFAKRKAPEDAATSIKG